VRAVNTTDGLAQQAAQFLRSKMKYEVALLLHNQMQLMSYKTRNGIETP
jgi:hypothetical protein